MILFFLDFDGVLHPFVPLAHLSDEENAHFSSLPAFEAAARACGEYEIVISSTWRKNHSMDEIRRLFSPDVAARILGGTPAIDSGNGDGARQAEVEAWLKENGRQGDPWIGIDDYPQLYRPGAAVVVCHDGFRERETALLVEAAKDPARFAERHPVSRKPDDERLVIVSGVKNSR
jgi:hypothetical protein